MAELGQAQVGHSPVGLRSTPKLTRINGDDNLKVIWKNMGNNHTYPLLWGSEHAVLSGVTTITLASGIKFHGMELATYGNVQAMYKQLLIGMLVPAILLKIQLLTPLHLHVLLRVLMTVHLPLM